MIAIISPAKSMNMETSKEVKLQSQPFFLSEAKAVNKQLRQLSASDLAVLMDISPKLAQLNYERNQIWSFAPEANPYKQAILAFTGDVYQGIQADTFTKQQLEVAQDHIRILSGLYGLLRPMDMIQAYRLEMGTRIEIGKAADLYGFWSEKVTNQLNKDLGETGNVLINLASNEYFKVLNSKKIKARIITPVFKDQKNGQYKIISFFAKKARGLMSRFIVENNISDPENLKAFDSEGYYFRPEFSNENDWVFTRE